MKIDLIFDSLSRYPRSQPKVSVNGFGKRSYVSLTFRMTSKIERLRLRTNRGYVWGRLGRGLFAHFLSVLAENICKLFSSRARG